MVAPPSRGVPGGCQLRLGGAPLNFDPARTLLFPAAMAEWVSARFILCMQGGVHWRFFMPQSFPGLFIPPVSVPLTVK